MLFGLSIRRTSCSSGTRKAWKNVETCKELGLTLVCLSCYKNAALLAPQRAANLQKGPQFPLGLSSQMHFFAFCFTYLLLPTYITVLYIYAKHRKLMLLL